MKQPKLPFSQRHGAVISLLLIIISFVGCIAVAVADEAREQALCVTDKEMASSIQFVRITSHDSYEQYKAKVSKWSKPGKAVGYAQTPEQIAIKDKFWRKNIVMAELIYTYFPVGWSPEYVGNQVLAACQYKFEIKRRQRKDDVQKFDV